MCIAVYFTHKNTFDLVSLGQLFSFILSKDMPKCILWLIGDYMDYTTNTMCYMELN